MNWAEEERISIVIPALDEAGNIGRLVEEIFVAVPCAMLAEVIVVDDGSNDGTASEVKKLMDRHPRLRLLRHARCTGQSASIRTGIRFAAGGIIATLDGDGQNDPADIPRLAILLEQLGPGTSLVGGIRKNRQAEGSKRLASKFANWLRDRVLADGCPDTGCGIKIFRRDAFLDLPFYCGMHRYLPALFLTYGHMVAYLPVNDRRRLAGLSKYTNLGRALIGIYDLIGVRWLRSRTRIPMVTEAARLRASEAVFRRTQTTPLAGERAIPLALAGKRISEQEAAAWSNQSLLGGGHSLPVI